MRGKLASFLLGLLIVFTSSVFISTAVESGQIGLESGKKGPSASSFFWYPIKSTKNPPDFQLDKHKYFLQDEGPTTGGETVAPIGFIEEKVILEEDDKEIPEEVDIIESVEIFKSDTDSTTVDSNNIAESVIKLGRYIDATNMEKAATDDDVKRYLLVQRLLNETPLIDGHNDLPWNLRKFLHGQLTEFDFNSDLRSTPPWSQSAWSQTDLPRLRRGRVGAQFWVAYAPCKSDNLDAVQITLEQIDLIRRLIAKYPEHLKLALSADDIVQAHKEGKIASLIAVEGGHCIGNSLAILRAFYDLGARSMTLTHTCNNAWADSSLVDTPGHKVKHGGLTDFGRTVVKEMNRLGMLVDLSHTSKSTMKDAIKMSEAPVIFSHSSVYNICNSSRNVPDDVLQEVISNRGVVMVAFYNYFVTCQENATLRDVVAHINYIAGRFGIEFVGIGGGFDGINWTPEGLKDVSMYPSLFVELAKNLWSNDWLKKLAGENFLRVFREAEHLRDKLRAAGSLPAQQPKEFIGTMGDTMRCRFNESTTTPSPLPVH